MKYLYAYVSAGLAMLVLDAIWLTSMVGFYRSNLGGMLLEGFRLAPAAAFYFIYVAGIVLLAVIPNIRDGGTVYSAALSGAIVGFLAYATYDLTNQATLKEWSTLVTMVDIAWGTVLTATTAAFSFGLTQALTARFG